MKQILIIILVTILAGCFYTCADKDEEIVEMVDEILKVHRINVAEYEGLQRTHEAMILELCQMLDAVADVPNYCEKRLEEAI